MGWIVAGRGSSRPCFPMIPPGTQGGVVYAGTPGNVNATLPVWLSVFELGVFDKPGLTMMLLQWRDIESVPGQYNLTVIEEQLEWQQPLGLLALVNIASINTNNVAVPVDLADPTDPTQLRAGLAWNSSQVTSRYAAMMGAVLPTLLQLRAVHVGVGNEVDVNLNLHPDTVLEFASFVETQRTVIHNLTQTSAPGLSVGVTMTFAGARAWVGGWQLPAIRAVSDSTPLTYYPMSGPNDSVHDPATIAADFVDMATLILPGSCVMIQECGYPSGFNNQSSVDNSTYSKQADFAVSALAAIRSANATSPGAFRGVSFSNLVDIPDELVWELVRYYRILTPGFIEYVATFGWIHSNGTVKPAATAFLAAIGGKPSD